MTALRAHVALAAAAAAWATGAQAAWAGGFAVAEQSAVAGGTASAGTARSDDASCAWFNPAALADGGGLRLGVGMALAMPSIDAEALDGSWQTGSEGGLSTPPYLYVSHGSGDFAYGVAVGVPFGGGVTWPEDWEGRHEIISTQLAVIRAAPFVAWSAGRLRVAGGLHVDFGRLQLRRSLDFVDTEGDVLLDLDGVGVGFDLAAFYEVSPRLSAGISYKSRTPLEMSGGADFTSPIAFDHKIADQHASTEMTMPDRLAVGVRYQSGPLAVLGDADLTLWRVNEETAIDFENDATPDPVVRNDWESTVGLRGGVEYAAFPAWIVRAGAFFDPSPATSETLAPTSPDSTRVGLTVGASRDLSDALSLDGFYEYMHLLSRDSESMESIAARYGGHAQILGLGLRYRR